MQPRILEKKKFQFCKIQTFGDLFSQKISKISLIYRISHSKNTFMVHLKIVFLPTNFVIFFHRRLGNFWKIVLF